MTDPKVKRVLMSVTDKTGIVEFARALSEEFGAQIISTGGTARTIAEAGIAVSPIEEVTNFPEMMDGRVKTLHPLVHGGLLAKRDNPSHMAQAEEHGIEMIDMVVVNLYAFEKTVESGAEFGTCIENIDIGGPSMLRSAAKNFESVAVVTQPESYEDILQEMRENDGATTYATRAQLALKVFQTTNAYDGAIANWLGKQLAESEADVEFPEKVSIDLVKQQDLRYGENPHQKAAFYRRSTATEHSLVNAKQLNGKPLSYNNLLDTDACWAIVREFEEPAVIILKHQNPCGSANGATIAEAFDRAFACDTKSAFGGIIAANKTVTLEMVEHINEAKLFVEVLIAPDYEPAALELLRQKANLRVLATGGIDALGAEPEFRTVDGGVLIQDVDVADEDPAEFTVPTKRKPTEKEMDDLLFAWKVVKGVKSNAILVAKDHAGIGIGPGQPNRVDSAAIACKRAGEKCSGAVCASDAFFPFRDNVDTLAEYGITAVIQPGGSVRDDECIQAADEHGIAMVFTGHRHFRH